MHIISMASNGSLVISLCVLALSLCNNIKLLYLFQVGAVVVYAIRSSNGKIEIVQAF